MSGHLTMIQWEVGMSRIRLSWAFGLALYFSFYLTTFLFLSTHYYYLEKCIGGLRVVGNGCVSGESLVDWMLYFTFSLIFSMRVFAFAYEL